MSPPGADGPARPPLARAWVLRTTPVAGRLESLASNGSLLVAAGADKIIISSDGVSWRLPRAPLPGSQVAFGANVFVAAAANGAVAWSPDGETWTAATVPAKAPDPDVAFGADTFAIVANGYGDGWLASSDGRAWTRRTVAPDDVRSKWNIMFDVFAVGGMIFASKATFDSGNTFVSTDGNSWRPLPEWQTVAYDVAFNGAIYCATGAVGMTYRSADGKTWTASRTGAESLRGVTSLERRFFLVGSYGTVMASDDCMSWEAGASPALPTALPTGEQLALYAVREIKGRLVAVGSGGRVYTAP